MAALKKSKAMMSRLLPLLLGVVAIGICSSCVGQVSPVVERERANNFEECVAEGGKILKSLPAQCITKGGDRFIEDRDFPGHPGACSDACGDGECQEVVCMMVGCPCAESSKTCPSDCPHPTSRGQRFNSDNVLGRGEARPDREVGRPPNGE